MIGLQVFTEPGSQRIFFVYLIKIFNAAKKYKNTLGMAGQFKVVSPNLFPLRLSTFHTHVKKEYIKLKGLQVFC